MTLAQHSSASNEHYTPQAVVEAARSTMGGIDLDPATTASVNASRVRASRYFTQAEDGLAQAWSGRVWLNPPGGRMGRKSAAAVWWDKLTREWASGRVEQAVFLGFTLEILATSQDSLVWVGELPLCVPRSRLEFLQASEDGTFLPGESPAHSNVIAFLPPVRGDAAVDRFVAAFSQFGRVRGF